MVDPWALAEERRSLARSLLTAIGAVSNFARPVNSRKEVRHLRGQNPDLSRIAQEMMDEITDAVEHRRVEVLVGRRRPKTRHGKAIKQLEVPGRSGRTRTRPVVQVEPEMMHPLLRRDLRALLVHEFSHIRHKDLFYGLGKNAVISAVVATPALVGIAASTAGLGLLPATAGALVSATAMRPGRYAKAYWGATQAWLREHRCDREASEITQDPDSVYIRLELGRDILRSLPQPKPIFARTKLGAILKHMLLSKDWGMVQPTNRELIGALIRQRELDQDRQPPAGQGTQPPLQFPLDWEPANYSRTPPISQPRGVGMSL